MNTLKYLILSLILLSAGAAFAKVVPITDWEDKLPYKEEEKSLGTTCAEACLGFDLTTLICPEGQKIDDCKEPGCSYYHRCINE